MPCGVALVEVLTVHDAVCLVAMQRLIVEFAVEDSRALKLREQRKRQVLLIFKNPIFTHFYSLTYRRILVFNIVMSFRYSCSGLLSYKRDFALVSNPI